MSRMCASCPFNFFAEESEIAQNYGCLPTPFDIVHMRTEHNVTWQCHDSDHPCTGALQYLAEKGLENKVQLPLIGLDYSWAQYCEQTKANEEGK